MGEERGGQAAGQADALLGRESGLPSIPLGAVGESPEVFVEQFQVPTWQEHLRQHEGRLTAEDQAIENAAFAHVLGAPRGRHHLPPHTMRASLAPRQLDYHSSGPSPRDEAAPD